MEDCKDCSCRILRAVTTKLQQIPGTTYVLDCLSRREQSQKHLRCCAGSSSAIKPQTGQVGPFYFINIFISCKDFVYSLRKEKCGILESKSFHQLLAQSWFRTFSSQQSFQNRLDVFCVCSGDTPTNLEQFLFFLTFNWMMIPHHYLSSILHCCLLFLSFVTPFPFLTIPKFFIRYRNFRILFFGFYI